MRQSLQYSNAREEFQAVWLPNISTSGLDRLIELLSARSPLLIAGMFTRAMPMGCLASHIAWHHPVTEHKHEDAGICWLSRVAKLNPATSRVILEWDHGGIHDFDLLDDLVSLCQSEREARLTKLCEQLTYDAPTACYA